jgi:hypothetical protein
MSRSLVFVLLLSALSASAFAQGPCQVFFDKNEFEVYNESHGKFLKGVEDFEESNATQGAVIGLPNPLRGNVPNVDPASGQGFPTGLEQKNIVIQDNVTQGCNPPNPNPGNTGFDLVLCGPGGFGSNSDKVGANYFVSSTDLIFPDPNENHTGIGLEIGVLQGFPSSPWIVSVFNKNGTLMASITVPMPPTPEPGKTFVGVWCQDSIGRINVCDQGVASEMVDDIQMWEEEVIAVEPATWGSIKNNYR